MDDGLSKAILYIPLRLKELPAFRLTVASLIKIISYPLPVRYNSLLQVQGISKKIEIPHAQRFCLRPMAAPRNFILVRSSPIVYGRQLLLGVSCLSHGATS
jgi:hypothetical protein